MFRQAVQISVAMFLLIIGLIIPANAAKRILFIDSYHEGYEWSDAVTEGVKSALRGRNAILKIYHMDTKRKPSEADKKQAALNAKEIIADFRPDVVIASDDNASKYLIKPYFKDSELPFVFCGVNYSADPYGFPYSNVTGMVELPPAVKLIYSLTHFTRITKVGYLAGYSPSDRNDAVYTKRDIIEDFIEHYVDNFEDWKKEFIRMQNEVDILIVGNNIGIENWDDAEARRFTLDNTKIPTGCLLDWMAPFAFLGATRSGQEHGAYAATTAMKIAQGASVSSFPIVGNVEANIIINKKIADKLGLHVPKSFLKRANKVIE